jgi:hypothetical protein
MNYLGTLLILVFFGLNAHSQCNAVFFSDGGEKFYVILNGLKYNEQAQTNVKVENLQPQAYAAKIIFENTMLGVVDDKVWLEAGKERTYQIRRKKIRDNGVEREVYVMKWMSETFITSTVQATSGYYPPPVQTETQPVVQVVNPTPPPVNTINPGINGTTSQTTTTTTTTYGSTVAPSTGINVNLPGCNVNMNLNDPFYYPSANTTVQQTQTTTTYNTPPIQPVQPVQPLQPLPPPVNNPVYVMPGYNGPIGCPWPANSSDFQSMKRSISSKTFEDTKLQVAKQILNSNCLTTNQVKEIMDVFTFEDSKLNFAKYAYAYTYDIGNYYKVNDAFTFSSSIDELNSFISGH